MKDEMTVFTRLEYTTSTLTARHKCMYQRQRIKSERGCLKRWVSFAEYSLFYETRIHNLHAYCKIEAPIMYVSEAENQV